jgi:Asp-tRNA(Asn)/Glu-tRNA(Gln) amidotransferase B subunit
VVEARGLYLVRDEAVIHEFVRDVMAGQENVVKKWRKAAENKRGKQLQVP